jgi:hypothetical protein
LKNNYYINDVSDFIIINLINRKGELFQTFIDKDDFMKVDDYYGTFFASYRKDSNSYYCCITLYLGMINNKPKYKTIYLHQIILNTINKKIEIDHKDHNTLNNCKRNLQISNKENNAKNRKRRNLNNTTGYRNVSFYKGWYLVQLQVKGKNTLFGKFKDVHEAGKFAELKRQEIYNQD